jgi:hypothetical protein
LISNFKCSIFFINKKLKKERTKEIKKEKKEQIKTIKIKQEGNNKTSSHYAYDGCVKPKKAFSKI